MKKALSTSHPKAKVQVSDWEFGYELEITCVYFLVNIEYIRNG